MSLLLAIKQNKVDEYVATEDDATKSLHLLNETLLHCKIRSEKVNTTCITLTIKG